MADQTPDLPQSMTEVDDAFRAIMEGLRTTLPGVQVLFAFLLTLPLQQSFSSLATAEEVSFFVAFFGSAIASILLIAPSAHQRRRGPVLLCPPPLQTRFALYVYGALNISWDYRFFSLFLAAAVYLITSIILETAVVAMGAGFVTLLMAWAWFYVPLVAFERTD